jgi:hypothetical protein
VFLAVRAMEVPVRSSYSHVTEVEGLRILRLALMVVMQNDGDFVNVILL